MDRAKRSFRRRTKPATNGRNWPHVVIVGGGFAGANAVLGLRKTRVRVTLIDQNVYKTFQPLLYQVATAGLNPGDVTMFLRGLQLKVPNMRFRQGRVRAVDTEQQTVTLHDRQKISYDYLILANGATVNFFNTPGAEEFAMPMYTRSQAIDIRDRIFAELERASQLSETGTNDKLHISVVGGGATGVEIAGALADFRQQELDVLYPEMDPGTLQIKLIQRGNALIKDFNENLQEYAADELLKRKVELLLGRGVKSVGYDSLTLQDDTVIESDITIWAVGVGADDEINRWGVPRRDNGRIEVDDSLRVKGFRNIFAIGDVAAQDEALPMLAQPAMQSGKHVASLISAEVDGKPADAPFAYRDLGTMATIGRHAAITQLPFEKAPDLTGSVGWWAWMGVHVMNLLGARNRRAVSTNLISLYAGMGTTFSQPNPVIGEVDSNRARKEFAKHSSKRRFGFSAGKPFSYREGSRRERGELTADHPSHRANPEDGHGLA